MLLQHKNPAVNVHVFACRRCAGRGGFSPCTAGGIKCRTRTHDSSIGLQHPVQTLARFSRILAVRSRSEAEIRARLMRVSGAAGLSGQVDDLGVCVQSRLQPLRACPP